MKLIIDIPEQMYLNAKAHTLCGADILVNAIKNGIPLSKDYGKLIDADKLIKSIEKKSKRLKNLDTINGLCGAVALIYEAKEGSE